MTTDYKNNQAIANFVEYLRIPSVQPNVNYDECVNFLKRQSNELGLQFKVYEVVPQKPIVVLTWPGQDPALPAILLNSHMDVVPVFESSWTYPPFSGHIDEDGKIFARGSQDMKCVGIQYLEAVRKLKNSGIKLKRTLHISFVPDEEIGGHDGMKKFVLTDSFKALNIGFALDEGMACPTEEFVMFNGERSIWQIHIICSGQPGHGSLLLPNTAGEKLRYMINKFMDLRDEQKNILDSDPKLNIGDVTSVNLTQIFVLAIFSHCGLLGLTEAIHHGVPVIGMPVFGDQPRNAAAVEESGLGVQIQFDELTKETLLEKFAIVLSPENKVKWISSMWKDRPQSSMDSAIYWLEYAARYHNVTFRTAAADVPLYQSLCLDIIFIFAIVFVTLFLAIKHIATFYFTKKKNWPQKNREKKVKKP